jgi:hypothetical protein
MPQNVAIRTSGAQFDFLEPAMVPDYARTDHVTVPNAGAGLFVTYLKAQILRQKDDGTNVFAKDGTAGYTGPVRVVKYTFTINDAGQRQLGSTFYVNVSESTFEGSEDVYYQGFFKCQDLVGTVDATVGRLVRGTYVTGILELGAATPV